GFDKAPLALRQITGHGGPRYVGGWEVERPPSGGLTWGQKESPAEAGLSVSSPREVLEVPGRVGGDHVADEIAIREAAVAAARVDIEQTITRADGELRHDRVIDADDAVGGEVGLVRGEAAEANAPDAAHRLADMREADARAKIRREAIPIGRAERR